MSVIAVDEIFIPNYFKQTHQIWFVLNSVVSEIYQLLNVNLTLEHKLQISNFWQTFHEIKSISDLKLA